MYSAANAAHSRFIVGCNGSYRDLSHRDLLIRSVGVFRSRHVW
jgi:hypothetical protein